MLSLRANKVDKYTCACGVCSGRHVCTLVSMRTGPMSSWKHANMHDTCMHTQVHERIGEHGYVCTPTCVCVCMRRRTLVQWVYLCARTHTCACLHILKAVTADAHARILFSRRSHVRTDRHLCISLPTSRRACHDNVLAREISPVRGVICASLLQSFVRFWQFESGGLLLSHEAVYRGQGQRKSNYFSLTRSESRGTSLPARDVFC